MIHAITLTIFSLAHAALTAFSPAHSIACAFSGIFAHTPAISLRMFHFFKSRMLARLGKGHAGKGSGKQGYETACHQMKTAEAEQNTQRDSADGFPNRSWQGQLFLEVIFQICPVESQMDAGKNQRCRREEVVPDL